MLGFVFTLNKKIKHILERDRLSTAVLQSLEAFPHSHSFIRPVVVMSKLSSLWLASRTDWWRFCLHDFLWHSIICTCKKKNKKKIKSFWNLQVFLLKIKKRWYPHHFSKSISINNILQSFVSKKYYSDASSVCCNTSPVLVIMKKCVRWWNSYNFSP